MADPIAVWATPSGVRFTASDDTLSVDVMAKADEAEGGISQVVFAITRGGVSQPSVTVNALALRTSNYHEHFGVVSPETGAAPIPKPFWGFDLAANPSVPGTVAITPTVYTANGSATVMRTLYVLDDSDGTDRRPSPKTIYIDADAGDDGNAGTIGSPMLTIQRGMEACATSGQLGGARLVLTAATADYVWAQGRYGSPNMQTATGWVFEIVVEDGAKITGYGDLNLNNGSVITSEPQSILWFNGTGSEHMEARLVLKGTTRQIEKTSLVSNIHSGNSGVFDVIGGVSGSHLHVEGVISLRYQEYRTGLWNVGYTGNTDNLVQAWCHHRAGVPDGFNFADHVQDCVVEDWYGIALQAGSSKKPDVVGCTLRHQRYQEDLLGRVDTYYGSKVAITKSGSTMRMTQIEGQQLTYGGGQTESGRAIDLAFQADELLESEVWGMRILSGSNAGAFVVTAAGYDESTGEPYIEWTNASGVAETPVGGALFMETYFVTGNNPAPVTTVVHPDAFQWLSDPAGSIVYGVNCVDVLDSVMLAVQNNVTSATDLHVWNCSDGGRNLRCDFQSGTSLEMTRVEFEHCTLGGFDMPAASARTVDCAARKMVVDHHSGDLSAMSVSKCHVIDDTAIGTDCTTGAWYQNDSTTAASDQTPADIYISAAGVDSTFYPAAPLGYAGPTKGGFRDTTDPDYDPNVIPPTGTTEIPSAPLRGGSSAYARAKAASRSNSAGSVRAMMRKFDPRKNGRGGNPTSRVKNAMRRRGL